LNHYKFLKNQMSDLFPNFSILSFSNLKVLKEKVEEDQQDEEYFNKLKENFKHFSLLIQQNQHSNLKEMIKKIIKELENLQNFKVKIKLFKCFFELMNLFVDLIQNKNVSKKMLNLTFEIERKFKLSLNVILFFKYLRLIALMFHSNFNIQKLKENYQTIQLFEKQNDLSNNSFGKLNLFTKEEMKKFIKEFNFNLILRTKDDEKISFDSCENVVCDIITESNLIPIVYHSFIPYSFSIDAMVKNLNFEKKFLRVLVEFPDNTKQFYSVELQDEFLNCQFQLNLDSSWNTSAHLVVSIVSLLSKENDEIYEIFDVFNDFNFVKISKESLKILLHPISN
jgi:hypothetical protein